MTIDKALERLNNKLSLIAVAVGIAAAVAPKDILPFIYDHRIAVCIYLIVGVAPIQELFHPIKAFEQMRTDRLGLVWIAKFVTLWVLVLVSAFLLILHGEGGANTPDTGRAVTDDQEIARENRGVDSERKNHSSVIEIRGGETLKYTQPTNLPKHQQKGGMPLDAGFVPIIYLGHKQEFALYCGVLGEQGTPPTIKGSTVTCP